jgi:hypothetical protein
LSITFSHAQGLFAGDRSRAASTSFQRSDALHYIFEQCVGARWLDSVLEDVIGNLHMTEIICPTFGYARDLYDALLGELAYPQTSLLETTGRHFLVERMAGNKQNVVKLANRHVILRQELGIHLFLVARY